MPVASAADLKAAGKGSRRFHELTLPVSGLTVRIRSLTESELAKFNMATVSVKGGMRTDKLEDAARRLFVLCLVDDAGNPLLSPTDSGIFSEWDAQDTGVLYDACAVHVGIRREDIEALVKNSEKAPAGN